MVNQMLSDKNFPGLGKRLRTFRKRAKLTAEELAEKIKLKFPNTGVSRQVLFNIEKGRKECSLAGLFEICLTLEIQPINLLCDTGKPFATTSSGTFAGKTPIEIADELNIGKLQPLNPSTNNPSRTLPDTPERMIMDIARQAVSTLNSSESIIEGLHHFDGFDNDTLEGITNMVSISLPTVVDSLRHLEKDFAIQVPPNLWDRINAVKHRTNLIIEELSHE